MIRIVVKRKLLLPILLIFTFSLYGQETVRIASYNVKQFPSASESNLKIVLNQIKPTILMVTELDGTTPVQRFLSNVLTPKYKASTEVTIKWGTGNECAVFYIDSLITYLGSNMISAVPRPFAEFKFVHKITKDTLIVFGAHLKAYPEETASRLTAVNVLRNRTSQFKLTANYMVVGDFNIFTSTEPAFQKLLDQSSNGYFIDMLNVTGSWNKNSQLAQYCTWSTSGGINTRFDMILISKAVNEKGGVDYVPDSFKIFGNDNKHYNSSVNVAPNDWFLNDPSIGTALKNASDHLPVYADFTFGVPTSVSTTENLPTTFELKQNYPNPFNPETVISYKLSASSNVQLKVYDLLGREIATLVNEFKQAGTYNSQFSTLPTGRQVRNFQLPSGVYFYQLKADNFIQTKKMILLK